MIVDELITLLKFDTQGMSKAEAFDSVLSSIENHAQDIVLGLTGAVASVGFFADRVSKSIAQNYEWAKSVGIASQSYQQFEHAAEIVGGSLDDIKGDLQGWVRSAKESGQTLQEVFLRETESIKGLTTEQSYALLQARGYSETSIRMIQQGEGQLRRFLSQAEVIPEENLKAAEEYARTWREVSSQINQLMTAAVASALPALRGILTVIRDFVQRNRELVKSTVAAFFQSVATSVKIFFAILKPVVVAVETLIKVFDFLTFGMGKNILIVGLLTSAFIALSVAATVKAVKGVFSLMGGILNLTDVVGKSIGQVTQLGFQIGALGFKEAVLNSALAQNINLWWKNTTAVFRNLSVNINQVKNTYRELAVMYLKRTAIGRETLEWYANTAAKIKDLFIGKGWIAQAWAFVTATWAKIAAFKIENIILPITTAWHQILAIYHAKGALAAANYAGVLTGKFIVAILKSIKSLIAFGVKFAFVMIKAIIAAIPIMIKFAFSIAVGLVKALINAIPLIASFAVGIVSSLIPALIGAAKAAWALTTAFLMNPLTWIIAGIVAGIVAIGAGIWAIIKYWDSIANAFKKAWDWVVDLFSWMKKGESTIAKIARGLTMTLLPLSAIYFYWEDIVGVAEKLWGWISSFFVWMKKGESLGAKIFKLLIESVLPITIIYFHWEKIVKVLETVVSSISRIFKAISQLLSNFWTKLPQSIQDFLRNASRKILSWIPEPIRNVWNRVRTLFRDIASISNSTDGILKRGVTSLVNFVLGLFQDCVNNYIKGINIIIRALNKIPGVKIPELKDIDLTIKERTEKSNKDMNPAQQSTQIISQSTMSQEQPRQFLSRDSYMAERQMDSEGWKQVREILLDLKSQSKSMDRTAKMRQFGVQEDTDEGWQARLAEVDAQYAKSVVREALSGTETGAVRSYDPWLQEFFKQQQQVMAAQASPMVGPANIATANPGMINNNQRNSSYIDQRTITINTTASSGPALAAYMRNTNDMMAAGIGMAGAF